MTRRRYFGRINLSGVSKVKWSLLQELRHKVIKSIVAVRQKLDTKSNFDKKNQAWGHLCHSVG